MNPACRQGAFLARTLPVAAARRLLKVMRLFRISVRKSADGYDKPAVELCFWAAFEEEHNVG